MQLTSKITTKYQATIPQKVRQELNLKAGDRVAFIIEDGQITRQKASAVDQKIQNSEFARSKFKRVQAPTEFYSVVFN